MKLTIFTPTYNRANKLLELYESILRANDNNEQNIIEWLIVDDGSLDKTEETVEALINKKELNISFYKKENGGKHTAFNLAIERCDGDLFVCIDDDDKLVPGAINNIFNLAERYAEKNYGAIVGRVVNTQSQLLGKTVFKDILISNTIEIRDKYHFWGEPEVYFVKYLKEFRFNVFENEKFLTEAYLFDEMSLKYPFVYTNEILMVKEFLSDGLTDNNLKIRINSSIGTVSYYNLRYKRSKGFINKLKAAINRRRFNYWNKDKKVEYTRSFISFLAVPFAKILYLIDKRRVSK